MSDVPAVSISACASAEKGNPLAMLAYGVIAAVGAEAVGRPLSPGMDDISMAMMNALLQQYYADDSVLGIDLVIDGSGDFLMLTHLNGVLRCSLVPRAGAIDFMAKGVSSADEIGQTNHAAIARSVAPQMVLARFSYDKDINPEELTLTGHFEISLTECIRRKLYLRGTGVFSRGAERFPVKFNIEGIDLTQVDESSVSLVEVTEAFASEAEEIIRKHGDNETPSFGIKEGLA